MRLDTVPFLSVGGGLKKRMLLVLDDDVDMGGRGREGWREGTCD